MFIIFYKIGKLNNINNINKNGRSVVSTEYCHQIRSNWVTAN